jgi:hypothetical protein
MQKFVPHALASILAVAAPAVATPLVASPPNASAYEYLELLQNGGFDAGLDHWEQDLTVLPAWSAQSGPAGLFPFGPAGDSFATPWTGGGHITPHSVSLWQSAVVPMGWDEATLGGDAFAAWDAVELDVLWYDNSGTLLRQDSLGRVGDSAGGVAASPDLTVAVPTAATSVTFIGEAFLLDGNWIDAGFDNASIRLSRMIPEPTTAAVVSMATLVLLRRRR